MGVDRHRQSVLRLFDAHNGHDLDAADEFYAEDAVTHLGGGLPLGTDQGVGETLIEAVPDVRFDVLDVVAQGEMGAVRLRGTGTHEDVIPAGLSPDALPGWSRSIDFEECIFSRFDADARIVEEWAAQELSLADKRFLDLPTTAVPMGGVIRWTTRTSTRLCAHDEHADIPGYRSSAERGPMSLRALIECGRAESSTAVGLPLLQPPE